MIILRNKKTQEHVNFELTRFPDGTSQAWKIDENANLNQLEIVWMFEDESEFMPVLQLITLLETKEIIVPFYPYARQDKPVTNTTTFAKSVFEQVLKNFGVLSIKTFDVHSGSAVSAPKDIFSVHEFHELVHLHDMVIYPDQGAVERYGASKKYTEDGIIFLYADKKRNQLTGQIEGIKLSRPMNLKNKKLLIIDDICDGGGTFIPLVKILKEYGAGQVDLCVSHGIFSKGTNILFDAGINTIYTTNSLIKNEYNTDDRVRVTNIIDLKLNINKKELKRYQRKMV